MNIYQEAVEALVPSPADTRAQSLQTGLINHSFKLATSYGEHILLQRINRQVFPHPDTLVVNYLALYEHLRLHAPGIRIARPLPFRNGTYVFVDRSGEYWRALEYIEGTVTRQEAEDETQAAQVAACFGGFAQALSGLDPVRIVPTLPGFHDLDRRFMQFTEALATALPGKKEESLGLVNELLAREGYVSRYRSIRDDPRFPLRLLHHDAKIGNVLFDTANGNVAAVVDLDTVMPGRFFSDIGDMIRSMAGSVPEDRPVFEPVTIRETYYDAMVNAYLAATGNLLTKEEKEWIHYSGPFLVYMQALRFLADHLAGDVYYQCRYPGQNLDRARNQLALLQGLEDFLHQKQYLPHE